MHGQQGSDDINCNTLAVRPYAPAQATLKTIDSAMSLQESTYGEDDMDMGGETMLTDKPKYSFDDLLEQVQVCCSSCMHLG